METLVAVELLTAQGCQLVEKLAELLLEKLVVVELLTAQDHQEKRNVVKAQLCTDLSGLYHPGIHDPVALVEHFHVCSYQLWFGVLLEG